MIWYILAVILIGLGIWGYFNTKKQNYVTHPDMNDDRIMHKDHSHQHDHKSGHGCCG